MNNYYYHKRAAEHQQEVSKELAIRTLLKGGRHSTSPAMRVSLRNLPVVAAVIVLILFLFAR